MKRLAIFAATLGMAIASAADPPARNAEQIVKSTCAECHATGRHGAPRIDDLAAWTPRLKKGLDATVLGAIRGHGDMPARGGVAGLTDAEFRSAVIYLFNSQYAAQRAARPAAAPGHNQRIVDGVEISLGVKPMGGGVHHVNVTLRDARTRAAIGDAQVDVGVTNPVMGGESKRLERFGSGDTLSYANDFRMSGKETHVITVQVRRKDRPRTLEARFDYKD